VDGLDKESSNVVFKACQLLFGMQQWRKWAEMTVGNEQKKEHSRSLAKCKIEHDRKQGTKQGLKRWRRALRWHHLSGGRHFARLAQPFNLAALLSGQTPRPT